jgi:hypothetical protein
MLDGKGPVRGPGSGWEVVGHTEKWLQVFGPKVGSLLKRLQDIVFGENYIRAKQILVAAGRVAGEEIEEFRTLGMTAKTAANAAQERMFECSYQNPAEDRAFLLQAQTIQLMGKASLMLGEAGRIDRGKECRTKVNRLEDCAARLSVVIEVINSITGELEEGKDMGEIQKKALILREEIVAKSAEASLVGNLTLEQKGVLLRSAEAIIEFSEKALSLFMEMHEASNLVLGRPDLQHPSESRFALQLNQLKADYQRVMAQK